MFTIHLHIYKIINLLLCFKKTWLVVCKFSFNQNFPFNIEVLNLEVYSLMKNKKACTFCYTGSSIRKCFIPNASYDQHVFPQWKKHHLNFSYRLSLIVVKEKKLQIMSNQRNYCSYVTDYTRLRSRNYSQ